MRQVRKRKPEEPLGPEAARNKALRLLGRREHSARELITKLRQDGVEPAMADELLGSLAEEGWQSDPRFAASRIQNRIAQGHGPIRIRAELRVAGLPEALIQEAMEAADCDWTALCMATHHRKFGRAPKDRAERQKQYNYLMQRGYDGEQIRAAMADDDYDCI